MLSSSKVPGSGSPTAYAVPTLRQARAVQALAVGEATKEQQKIALDWIFKGACRAGREVLAPGQADVTAYLAGRLSVMMQIGWVLGQPADAFRARGEKD